MYAYMIDDFAQRKTVWQIGSGKDTLRLVETLTLGTQEALVVDHPKVLDRLFVRNTGLGHSIQQTVDHSQTSTTSTEAHDALLGKVLELETLLAQSTQYASKSHSSGALNIIVEAEVFVAVLLQQRLGSFVAKIEQSRSMRVRQ
jgi:hypothetical protein